MARRIEITSSKKNATKRATKLATLKAGKAVGPKKPAALKKVGAVAGLLPAPGRRVLRVEQGRALPAGWAGTEG